MTNDRTRRQFLGGIALAAAGALAGCTGGSNPPLEPRLPEQRIAETGWTQVENLDEQTTQPITIAGFTQSITVDAKADIYENTRPAERVKEEFGVESEQLGFPPSQFVAAKARTDPPLHRLVTLADSLTETLLDRAERQAKRQLRRQGFENIRRVNEGSLSIRAAGEAIHRRYEADYPYGEGRFTWNGVPVTLQSGTFTIEAQLAAWPYDGLLAVAGGAYPGEEGQFTLSVRDAMPQVSLGLAPDSYRSNVRELITLVA